MAPPANDNFASATSIATASGTLAGTTFDATKEASESTTIGTNVQSVWYVFTAPVTGWYKFWVPDSDIIYHGIRAFENSTLQIMVFPDGALSAMTSSSKIADSRNESSNDYDAGVAFFLTSGTVYRIRLASFLDSAPPGGTNTQTCDFTLHWAQLSRPANDDLASATSLGSIPVSETGETTFDATFESGEVLATTLGGIGYDKEQSVWYTFTPAASGKYRITLDNISPHGNHQVQSILQIGDDNTLATYTPANELARLSVSGGGTKGTVYVDLVASTTYYIRVSSAWANVNSDYAYNGNTIDFDLLIDIIDPPANDDFANAEVLSTTLPGTVSGADTYDATQEAAEPDSGFPFAADDQTIWYKFTPTVSGKYKFTIPQSSLVYTGDNTNPNNGELAYFITEITALSQLATATLLGGTKFVDYVDTADVHLYADLVATHTYYIRVWLDGTPFNNDAMQFDLEYDLVPPPTNDDVADAEVVTGSSGSTSIPELIGASSETNEPAMFYWYEDDMAGRPTVWYKWTAPSSGWFEFRAASHLAINGAYDCTIYTGTDFTDFVVVVSNEGGGEDDTENTNGGTTVLRFLAVNGTDYWIQVGLSPTSVDAYNPTGELTWATASAPTGDTTSSAITTATSRENNYGNTDNELPPNAVTRLSSHGDWWYTTGAVGRSKWWKLVATADGSVTISGAMFNDGKTTYNEYALLAYKGANFAGLTAATTQDAEDAVMIGFGLDPATTIADATEMVIDYTNGETVWLCLVSLYDADYNADTVLTDVERCPATELDLLFGIPAPDPPLNDDRLSVLYTNHFWLANSHWDDFALPNSVWPEALLVEGTTVAATPEVGDPTVAGFAPTNNVWYATSWAVPIGTPIKVWVESAVDCVLGIYKIVGTLFGTPTIGALVDDDDDSGPGDQPEITFNYDGSDYYIVVDSKTPGPFTLKYAVQHTGTPPANDAFANATTIVVGTPISGTTVEATAEPGEWDAAQLGSGQKDTVWYKYVADHDGILKLKATCDSSNNDAYVYVDTWHGTTLANLVRHPDPPPEGPGGGLWRGFFNHFDTPAELEAQALAINVVNGETYYIRVQTESGGSEDFTLYLDEQEVYIHITPGGSDEMHGTLIDSAEVYVNIQVSGGEVFHQATVTDAATVPITITVGGNDIKGFEYVDAATVRVSLTIDSHDCQTMFDPSQLTAYCHRRLESRAYSRWLGTEAYRRFEVIAGDGLEEC